MKQTVCLIMALAFPLWLGCTPDVARSVVDAFAASFGDVVPVPEGDKTPPAVTFTVPDVQGGADITLSATSPDLVVNVPENWGGFFVVAAAEDSEGVQSVAVLGEARLTCNSGDGIGQIRIATIIARQVDEGTVGGNALTRRWIPFYVQPQYIQCAESSTFSPVRMEYRLRGQGVNFGGQIVTTAGAQIAFNLQ